MFADKKIAINTYLWVNQVSVHYGPKHTKYLVGFYKPALEKMN